MENANLINNYMETISAAPLFDGIKRDKLANMLVCLQPSIKILGPGEVALNSGDTTRNIGIVISGCIHAVKVLPDGTQRLHTRKTAGEIYGEVLACTENVPSPVTLYSEGETAVMLIDHDRMLKQCANTCGHHSLLIRNLLMIISRQYFALHENIDYLTKKSVRAKLSAYLYDHSGHGEHNQFMIPLNRSELADYLGVDRSAMSRELSRMKQEGIIDFYKNSFKVIDFSRFEA